MSRIPLLLSVARSEPQVVEKALVTERSNGLPGHLYREPYLTVSWHSGWSYSLTGLCLGGLEGSAHTCAYTCT